MAEGPWTKYGQTPPATQGPWSKYEGQELTAPDPTSPVQSKFGERIQDDPSRYAKVTAQAIASLPTEPVAKINYIAKSLGVSPDRVGLENGRIYYVDYGGNQFYAEPGGIHPILDPVGTLARIPDITAGAAGPAMETIGGMAGGLLTAEAGPGSVLGAAAGGAIGNAARQGLAYGLTNEEKSLEARGLEMAGAAAQEGAGQALGYGLAKTTGGMLNRNPLRVAGYDAGGLSAKRIAEMEAAAEKARNMGIQVTPGEAGDVASLLQRQRQLGRIPESTTQMNDFLKQRSQGQVPAAWEGVLNEISGVSAPGVGARNLATGAAKTIEGAVKAQRAVAGPKYEAVVNAQNLLPKPLFNNLMADDVIKSALKGVRSDKILNSKLKVGEDNSLLVLDATKKHLDAMYNEAKRKGNNFRASVLDEARKKLLSVTDTVFPDYAVARSAFAGQVPEVAGLKGGLTGLVSAERKAGWQNAPAIMFGSTSADPMSIATARNAFAKAGRMDEWNAGLRSFLQNAFDKAAKMEKGPASGVFKALKADTRQYNNLKAAMTPQQSKAFDDFMDVMEMVKRAPAEGSPTATDIGGRESFAGPVAKGISGTIRALNPLTWPNKLGEKILDWSAGRNAAEMVNIITNPEAIKSLRRLKMLKPGTEKFITELGYLSAISGFDVLKGPGETQPAQVLGGNP